MKNTTDYDFPPMWGEMSVAEKHRWYIRERVFRQAIRQDTAFGRRYRSDQEDHNGVDFPEAYKRAGRGGYEFDP